jgi:hypothetical protein
MWMGLCLLLVGAGVYVFKSCRDLPGETLDKTGKLKRLQKNDAALGKARAVNAACMASDDIRLKGRK